MISVGASSMTRRTPATTAPTAMPIATPETASITKPSQCASAAGASSSGTAATAIFVVALLFIAFAIYGTGLEASLWCLVLLAAGLAIRTVMRRLNSRAANPATEAAPV